MNAKPSGVVPGVTLLVVRGILLWVLIPLGFVGWIVTLPWTYRQQVSLGGFLGWLDNNLVIAIARSLLRPWFPEPTLTWTSAKDIAEVTHRIGVLDPY
ncbi:MAG: hypothetical protein QOH69_1585 [Actinomycetota bacterium]|jgi:hypothetical protein|nr:hypothetical protein [Actinomycetota bacterium]